MDSSDLVWVDTGEGPIKAVWAKPSGMGRTHWIRTPIRMKRSEVQIGMIILSDDQAKFYQECIKQVEKRKKSLKK